MNYQIIRSKAGLSATILPNGSVGHIDADTVRINLKPETPFSRHGANVYLRKRSAPLVFHPLMGPDSNSRFIPGDDAFLAEGSWEGLRYTCVLQFSAEHLNWHWLIDIQNLTGDAHELDVVYVQDVGLKPVSGGLINEYYVSQYIERLILQDNTHGPVVCCRQNMADTGGNPWLMLACRNGAASAATDGMQIYGKTCRETGIPEGLQAKKLGGEHAGESSRVALQERPFVLNAGDHHRSVFGALFLHHHPEATSEKDLNLLADLFENVDNQFVISKFHTVMPPAKNIFTTAGLLPADDFSDDELTTFFGPARNHAVKHYGQLLSFFNAHGNHVVLRAKELLTDRPHAHIMQTGTGFAPDEAIVSTTSFACGIFNSHITQGNTNFNILLSVGTSAFNLSPESGQRIFARIEGRDYLLGVPSAFEMGLNYCRWIYKTHGYVIQVRSWTTPEVPVVNMDVEVLQGGKLNFLITNNFDDLNEWKVIPGETGNTFFALPKPGAMMTSKFPDARFRMVLNGPSTWMTYGDERVFEDHKKHGFRFFIIETDATNLFGMQFVGEITSRVDESLIFGCPNQFDTDLKAAGRRWQHLSRNLVLQGSDADLSAISEILPWFGMNALTHFLTPYGIEQFSGAAWGTRDIAQGPFDLLLCMGRYQEAREVLCIIFSRQNPDGGWPQWWMFDSYRNIRADSAHGDVVYWCLIALTNYVAVTGDNTLLDEILPYYHEEADKAEKSPLSEHVNRLTNKIIRSFLPGTALVPFGGGDWNDSLQPVSKKLAESMISSWTVEMNYQAFHQLAGMYRQLNRPEQEVKFEAVCDQIREDFNKYFVRDEVVAGYGQMEADGTIKLLLHPTDELTGIQYSILPMNRGIISGIFTREQALHHQELIELHLKGPDGARLMDRPLQYHGGIQTIFQRAESSTYFGREIGIMYVHEHIRYAEALAITGKADAFVRALRQANPVDYREVVPCGDIRQANCYYSSSDVVFKSRYDADERYEEVLAGKFEMKGGWRIYSSGPGIYIGLVVNRLLGIRLDTQNIVLDPVIPASMSGLSASMTLLEKQVTFRYLVREKCFSPDTIRINGHLLQVDYVENPYRKGGAVINLGAFRKMMDADENLVEIIL